MTAEEVIKALRLMEHVESISTVYEPGEVRNDTTVRELKDACRMAITALRAQTDFNGTYVNASRLKQVEAERDAAMKYIPHTCETCKWWHKVSDGMMCCKAPEELGKCYLGHGKAWQWRGINDGKTD